MTSVDIEVNWVQCDEYNKWLHTLCEYFNPAKELSIENLDKNVCLGSRDIAQDEMVALVREKAAETLSEADSIRSDMAVL